MRTAYLNTPTSAYLHAYPSDVVQVNKKLFRARSQHSFDAQQCLLGSADAFEVCHPSACCCRVGLYCIHVVHDLLLSVLRCRGDSDQANIFSRK